MKLFFHDLFFKGHKHRDFIDSPGHLPVSGYTVALEDYDALQAVFKTTQQKLADMYLEREEMQKTIESLARDLEMWKAKAQHKARPKKPVE
jgi:hypothetical protein